MARRSKRKKTEAERKEILNKPVRLDGSGESPMMKELLNVLQGHKQLSPRERAELVAKIQEELTGVPMPEHIKTATAQGVAEREAAEKEWAENRERFLEKSWSEAERNMPTEEQKAKIKAQVSQEYQDHYAQAVARQTVEEQRMREIMRTAPKEEIHVQGITEMHRVGDNIRPVNVGETIRVNGVAVHLNPGKHVVPAPIAQRYREILDSRAETEERKKVMSGDLTTQEYRQGLKAIDKKYKTHSELV